MTSADSEDIVLRFGRLDSERDVVRELWFRPVALDVFVRWLDRCAALQRLRPNDVTSPDFCASVLRAALGSSGDFWVLTLSAHDAGLLHEIAEHALLDGVASLTVDGEAFTGEAPFFVFTERVPGQPNRVLAFDPLRGESSDEAAIDALLAERMAGDVTLAQMIRSRPSVSRFDLLGWVNWVDDGRVLPSAQWRRVGASEPSPISAVVSLVVLAPIALVVPSFVASLSDTVGAAVMLSVFLVSGLMLVPLKWPSGHAVSLRVRALWFVVVPGLWAAVMHFARLR